MWYCYRKKLRKKNKRREENNLSSTIVPPPSSFSPPFDLYADMPEYMFGYHQYGKRKQHPIRRPSLAIPLFSNATISIWERPLIAWHMLANVRDVFVCKSSNKKKQKKLCVLLDFVNKYHERRARWMPLWARDEDDEKKERGKNVDDKRCTREAGNVPRVPPLCHQDCTYTHRMVKQQRHTAFSFYFRCGGPTMFALYSKMYKYVEHIHELHGPQIKCCCCRIYGYSFSLSSVPTLFFFVHSVVFFTFFTWHIAHNPYDDNGYNNHSRRKREEEIRLRQCHCRAYYLCTFILLAQETERNQEKGII